MPLITDPGVVRIDLPAAGEWVEVKAVLSRGDEVAIQKRLMAGTKFKAQNIDDMEFDAGALMERVQFATLEVALVAWSFDAPVTPENIRLLDSASARLIEERMDELYETRTEDEKNG